MTDKDERLAQIRERAEKATAGPWRYENTSGAGLQIFAPVPRTDCVEFVISEGAESPIYGFTKALPINRDGEILLAYEQWIQFAQPKWERMQAVNAEFIAHAREDIPYLLDTIDRLTAERDARNRYVEKVVATLKQEVGE